MDFRAFRELKGWTLERAADELNNGADITGVNASLVRKHEEGIHFPRPALLARYAEITDGAVKYEDWDRLRREREAQLEAAARTGTG